VSWTITAGTVRRKHDGSGEAPLPSGTADLLIGAAIAIKIGSTVKAGGNPLEGIRLEDTQRALAADLGTSHPAGACIRS